MMEALEEDPGITSFLGCYDRGVSVRTEEGTIDGVALRSTSGWTTYTDTEGMHPVAEDYICLYPRADGLRRYGRVGELPRLVPTDEAVVRPHDSFLLQKGIRREAARQRTACEGGRKPC